MQFSRRDLAKLALAAVPAAKLLAKPNSRFGGVQIGINAPYSFHNMPGGADDIIKYLTQLNLSAVELRTQPVEGFLGAPVVPPAPGRNKPPLTQEEQAARRTAMEDLRKWRLALSTDRI